MPKVTIWIRESDYETWMSILDRPTAIAWLIEQKRKQKQQETVDDTLDE